MKCRIILNGAEMKSSLSKKAKIAALLSMIWLILIFVAAINESRGDIDEEFLSIFLVFGGLPVLIGWGIRWIRQDGSEMKE